MGRLLTWLCDLSCSTCMVNILVCVRLHTVSSDDATDLSSTQRLSSTQFFKLKKTKTLLLDQWERGLYGKLENFSDKSMHFTPNLYDLLCSYTKRCSPTKIFWGQRGNSPLRSFKLKRTIYFVQLCKSLEVHWLDEKKFFSMVFTPGWYYMSRSKDMRYGSKI